MDFQVYRRSEEHIEGDHIEFRSHVPLSLTVADARKLAIDILTLTDPADSYIGARELAEAYIADSAASRANETARASIQAAIDTPPVTVESNVTEMDTRKRKHS